MHLSAAQLAVALLAVAIGGFVQGAVGFGLNLVAVPIVALLEPATVPGTFVLLGLPMSLLMATREHHAIDWRGVGGITLGRVPGTVAGAVLVASLPGDAILVVVGVSVVAAAALSRYAPPIAPTRRNTVLAGVASGTTGTAAALDGPPLALLYQHSDGPVIRSTLAAAFVLGTVLSLAGLLAAGEVAWWQVGLAAALLPGMLAGNLVSPFLSRRLGRGHLRATVLLVAGVAGLAAAVRGLL